MCEPPLLDIEEALPHDRLDITPLAPEWVLSVACQEIYYKLSTLP